MSMNIEQQRAQKLLEVKAEGEKRNWILLTKVYGGVRSKVEFTCGVLGHKTFSTGAGHMKRSKGCELCDLEQNRTQKLLEIKAEGEKRNWILLTKVYGGVRSKVEFTCMLKHKSFSVRADGMKRTKGCTICNPRSGNRDPALCEQEFRKIVEEKEGTIIGGTYSGNTTEFDIICINRHEFKGQPVEIFRGSWCRQCSLDRAKLKSARDFYMEVVRRGGTCMDTYVDNATKLLILCHSKHEFRMAPGCVKCGRFCPKCAGKCPAQSKEKFLTEVKEKEGTCIGEYLNNDTLTKIRCKAGHEFMVTPHNVKTGYWCPVCYGHTPDQGAQNYYAKLEERGGTRIDNYAGSETKVRILCGRNHTFAATPHNITSGDTWCPICRESKGANQVRGILKALNLPYASEYTTPATARCKYDFAVNHNGKHVFIEYDGEQHFRESYFHTGEAFLRARNRDIFKTRAVIQHYQCKLIRIDYKSREDGLNLHQFIEQSLKSPALFIVSNLEMYSWLENGLRGSQPLELPPEDEPYTEDDSEPTSSPQAVTETITAAFESITIC